MDETQQFIQLINGLQSPDNNVRKQAEQAYGNAKSQNPKIVFSQLVTAVGNQSLNEADRKQMAILARQFVVSVEAAESIFQSQFTQPERLQGATQILRILEKETNAKVRNAVRDLVGVIAKVSYNVKKPGLLHPGECGWQEFFPSTLAMADASKNPNEDAVCATLKMLSDLVDEDTKCAIKAQQSGIGIVLQSTFASNSLKVKREGCDLVCQMVCYLDKSDWAPLQGTAVVMLSVIQGLTQQKDWDTLTGLIQSYTQVVEHQPEFFKKQLEETSEPATFLGNLVLAGDEVSEEVRKQAMEWLTAYAEKRPKAVAKKLSKLVDTSIKCCMKMASEVPGDEDSVKEWIERMDDEEGDDDEEDIHELGLECIDRIVEKVGLDVVKTMLFSAIGSASSQESWQMKLAALSFVRQTIEYVDESDESTWTEMVNLLLSNVDHPHPRVRYAALHAIGQVSNDQHPHFQDKMHKTVVPVLLKKMDDPIDRVKSMAMSAFVSFGEELDESLMSNYTSTLMEKLAGYLTSSGHRMVQEESITSIAVIAAKIGADFAHYYQNVMPMLKQIVTTRTDKKMSRLRGKAFECMSLLGLAVGKDKFLPDCKDAMEHMLKMEIAADDIQAEYIKEATERIAKCLKKDFGFFLPYVFPRIEKGITISPTTNTDADDEDEYIQVDIGGGKFATVHTSKFEEITHQTQLLHTISTEMEGSFFDYVEVSAKVLLPLLDAQEDVAYLCEDARATAFSAWGALVNSSKLGCEERNLPQNGTQQLVKTLLTTIFNRIGTTDDSEMLRDFSDGIAACLNKAGPGIVSGTDLIPLVQKSYEIMHASMQRSVDESNEKKRQDATAPTDLMAEEDDEEDDIELDLRRSLTDLLGAVMVAAPADFVQNCLKECGEKMTNWNSVPEFRIVVVQVACELLEKLKQESMPIWPVFMPTIFNGLTDKDAVMRTSSAYCVNLASPLPGFAEAAPEAYRKCAQVLSQPAPKKRDATAKIASDNLVSALCKLCQHKPESCPADVDAWGLIVAKLPLKDDDEEAKAVHEQVAKLVLEQHAGLLGPNSSRLAKILGALSEVYQIEDICQKETDQKIHQIFKHLPQDALMQMASNFTEKQQKKIEKMLTQPAGVAALGG